MHNMPSALGEVVTAPIVIRLETLHFSRQIQLQLNTCQPSAQAVILGPGQEEWQVRRQLAARGQEGSSTEWGRDAALQSRGINTYLCIAALKAPLGRQEVGLELLDLCLEVFVRLG